uniref:C2H2-type domain-containing protein n=1 Tax=Monodelphis domestica TaxID=13616 RepID=A0A5F8GU68_MONDO
MSDLSPPEGEPPEADEEEIPSDEQGLIIHHPAEEQAYRCLLCGQTFPQQSSLVRHQKAHAMINGAGRALYVCPECGKAFNIQHNLSVHQRQDMVKDIVTHVVSRHLPSQKNLDSI